MSDENLMAFSTTIQARNLLQSYLDDEASMALAITLEHVSEDTTFRIESFQDHVKFSIFDKEKRVAFLYGRTDRKEEPKIEIESSKAGLALAALSTLDVLEKTTEAIDEEFIIQGHFNCYSNSSPENGYFQINVKTEAGQFPICYIGGKAMFKPCL